MLGAGERILEGARPGVLHKDLAACDAYGDALEAAAKVAAPTLLLCGERDQMTPLKGARALAGALASVQLVVLEGAGHMLMAERPDEVLRALAGHLAVDTSGNRPASPTAGTAAS
jgi:pimeloyl-ACP methyl ester carboxylesterase